MKLTSTQAFRFLLIGPAMMLAAILRDGVFGDQAVATTASFVLLVGGFVLFMIGLIWYLRHPVRRRA